MKKITAISCLTFLISSLFVNNKEIPLYAHEEILDVSYDYCSKVGYNDENFGDDINEVWYYLKYDSNEIHIYNDGYTPSVKYYFVPNTDIEHTEFAMVKEALKTSMEKWNNVYFYKFEANGSISKYKLANIEEGTQNNYNVEVKVENSNLTATIDTVHKVEIEDDSHIRHYHATYWEITYRYNLNETLNDHHLSRVGAHEIGHVLGLKDVDFYEEGTSEYDEQNFHHEEILMGYRAHKNNIHQSNITYKDLVGVAITQGFHTDNDHSWMLDNARNKLICSICNGVKDVNSLSDYTYVSFNSCQNNHDLSSNNLMAVASYGNLDYYKCKYCRYVAPFENLVNQEYTYSSNNTSTHYVINQVNGLEYTFLEQHNFGAPYTKRNDTTHYSTCQECNTRTLKPHVVISGQSICIHCGGTINNGFVGINSTIAYKAVTNNGSYILENGIIVLVEDDLQSYLDGTLIFNDVNSSII